MTDRTDLQFTTDHEWLAVDDDVVTVGITDYAAEQLGDIVFVELPAPGDAVAAGAVVGEVESTKSVGELFAPVAGTVVERNEAVVDAPESINGDAFAAWLLRVRFDALPDGLLDAAAYDALIGRS